MNKLPIAKNLQIERSRTTLLFNHWTPERTAAAVGVNRDEVQMQQRGETEWESVQAKNRQLVNELEKHRPSPGSARRTAVVHAGLQQLGTTSCYEQRRTETDAPHEQHTSEHQKDSKLNQSYMIRPQNSHRGSQRSR
jgi:hypothetical protein